MAVPVALIVKRLEKNMRNQFTVHLMVYPFTGLHKENVYDGVSI